MQLRGERALAAAGGALVAGQDTKSIAIGNEVGKLR